MFVGTLERGDIDRVDFELVEVIYPFCLFLKVVQFLVATKMDINESNRQIIINIHKIIVRRNVRILKNINQDWCLNALKSSFLPFISGLNLLSNMYSIDSQNSSDVKEYSCREFQSRFDCIYDTKFE
jgi:hypothetical protein